MTTTNHIAQAGGILRDILQADEDLADDYLRPLVESDAIDPRGLIEQVIELLGDATSSTTALITDLVNTVYRIADNNDTVLLSDRTRDLLRGAEQYIGHPVHPEGWRG
jgi:hypothetical protein